MDIVSRLRLVEWSLRKLRLGIRPGDLVLEVGSGGNPHPRSDVLLEKYFHGQHRHGVSVVTDRPTVFADACHMPFRDKAFDYIIAFHVLEHMRDPAAFLNELMRVGKAGYIETPNVMFERLDPYDVHLLEIMDVDGKLHIRKKARPASDRFLAKLRLHKRDPLWSRSFYGDPKRFHVRYFWTDRIDYEIENPEETCAWFQDEEDAPHGDAHAPRAGSETYSLRAHAMRLLRRAQRLRPQRAYPLDALLACVHCHGPLQRRDALYVCDNCKLTARAEPYPNFNVEQRL
jgi:SAM-dependent methyltransferase